MKKTEKPIIALMYDFDKTLSRSDMQDYGFIPALGMSPSEFWGETGRFQAETGVERILSYMYSSNYYRIGSQNHIILDYWFTLSFSF